MSNASDEAPSAAIVVIFVTSGRFDSRPRHERSVVTLRAYVILRGKNTQRVSKGENRSRNFKPSRFHGGGTEGYEVTSRERRRNEFVAEADSEISLDSTERYNFAKTTKEA